MMIERRTKMIQEIIEETFEGNRSYYAGNRSALAEKILELEREAEALNEQSILEKKNSARQRAYDVRGTAFVLRAVEAHLDGKKELQQEALDRAFILYKAAELPANAGEYETEEQSI